MNSQCPSPALPQEQVREKVAGTVDPCCQWQHKAHRKTTVAHGYTRTPEKPSLPSPPTPCSCPKQASGHPAAPLIQAAKTGRVQQLGHRLCHPCKHSHGYRRTGSAPTAVYLVVRQSNLQKHGFTLQPESAHNPKPTLPYCLPLPFPAQVPVLTHRAALRRWPTTLAPDISIRGRAS